MPTQAFIQVDVISLFLQLKYDWIFRWLGNLRPLTVINQTFEFRHWVYFSPWVVLRSWLHFVWTFNFSRTFHTPTTGSVGEIWWYGPGNGNRVCVVKWCLEICKYEISGRKIFTLKWSLEICQKQTKTFGGKNLRCLQPSKGGICFDLVLDKKVFPRWETFIERKKRISFAIFWAPLKAQYVS